MEKDCIEHTLSGSTTNQSGGDMEKKHDPDAILYDSAAASDTERREAAVGKDGHVDPESAEITADTTLDTSLKLVTQALDVTDNPEESPYTFRAFVIGLGLSAFGAVIAEIFYFKPQTVNVNVIFLIIIAFCIGEATLLIPRWGPIGRFCNPGPFNQKEHVFIVIMASSAAVSALGTEQLAVQSLYYNEQPNAASAIFMLFSSQCIGYGLLGMMRKTFVYPTKFVWPLSLPLASLFQSMHLNKELAKKRLRVFWWVCLAIMVWELIPEYVFPLTVGISIFCLANQNSEYIGTQELVLPMSTLVNQFIGYLGCVILTVAAYYSNLWNAQNFPFLAQALFTENGTVYNQTEILGANNEVDPDRLAAYGLPWFTTSNALSLLVMNCGITAAVVHVFLWNWDDVKFIFEPFKLSNLKRRLFGLRNAENWKLWKADSSNVESGFPGTEGDPHFAAMRAYKDAPSWLYHAVLILAILIGLICCYQQNTGLPWWAFLIAVALAWFLSVIYACMYGIVGFYYQPTSAIQMIGGYLVPRRPVANMMFTLYGSNGLVQALLMLGDLKLAHIVANQRDILLSVEGTNLWSGQNVQTYNAQAVAWGGAGNEIFGRDGVYWMVPMGLFFGLFLPWPFWIGHKFFPRLRLDYINTFIITTWLGWLSVGINSSLLPYFVFGFFVQGYVRRYKPVFFAKWNLIIAAAIAGGCSLIIFILTFAVSGGSGGIGEARQFPVWWGNNRDGNVDRCLYMNGE
ncbi:OPT oligopeptide transporter protein-domain-containing protein [Diplogelasinospora grovesii]|uniref:OPT oligopeptide transporter protein-domain-containing protein n=1 Tax=Diplogelasinospora grovesii TaxID=303347 RepID=A0AAN6RZU9_9PEZI|nr:OPT oligopeptide transporter protein-domain-containing protein [Diplogelasinospora grovesii]